MDKCDHLWTMFCQGAWWPNWQPYWRVDICIHCYARRQVKP